MCRIVSSAAHPWLACAMADRPAIIVKRISQWTDVEHGVTPRSRAIRGSAGDAMSENQGPGPLALVGSGEYLPQMAEIEGGLIAGRPPRYVQIATAAVPDGPPVVERWHNLGRAQAERLGVEAVILDDQRPSTTPMTPRSRPKSKAPA